MFRDSSKYQYYATVCVNLMSLAYGAVCGWPSASFLTLRSATSPLESGPLTTEQTSWVGSILCVGGFTGNIIFSWMSDRFGRKNSLLMSVIPQMLSWLLIIHAKNATHLCISRFMGGISGGAIFLLIPLYITEISEDSIRGSLGSFLVLSCNIGILLAFILGSFMEYNTTPYIFICLPIVFFFVFIFLPESPLYLMKTQKGKEAEKSLRYYRNLRKMSEPPAEFKAEIEKLKHEYLYDTIKGSDEPLTWKDFDNPIARRTMLIGIALMALNQFCGCFAMLNYTANIFQESGSTLSPNVSAIIVGVIQLIGSYVSTVMVERSGRKFLLTVSALGTGFGLVSLGMYTYLKMLGFNVTKFDWVPIVSFSFVIFIASWGVLTLPFLVLSEIIPPKIRNFGISVCMSMLWIFAFLIIKYLPILTEILQMHGCMFIFAACSFAGAIFVMIFVPETKAKSIDEIMAFFEAKVY